VVKLFNQLRADPAMGYGAMLWRFGVIMGCLWYLASATGVVLNWLS
jgi:hypothetical protein